MSEAAGLVVDHLAGASIAPPNNSTGQSPVSALGLRISVFNWNMFDRLSPHSAC